MLKSICTSYEEYQVLLKNYEVSRRLVKDSEESLRLLEPLYNEGKKSIADLLELRVVNLNSKISVSQTEILMKQAAIRLLFSAGLLEESHLKELSGNITEEVLS